MEDETDDPEADRQRPESLLPYDDWTEQALRHVALKALAHAASEGLPGAHHFYLTFRTDHPFAEVPPRLREKYPQEITIVLQHQFWDLAVEESTGMVTVGLSFGGVPATLRIPAGAITAFADPHVNFGLRFRPEMPELAAEEKAEQPAEPGPDTTPQVVSLDAFRRRPTPGKG
jgi:hypothetical protein